MGRSITIIGAGIAGLSAGCYGQMNGYDTRIFELHDKPGGCCTSWKRKGYTIDGCLHWLTGSGRGQVFYPLWEEVGAVQGRTFVDHEEYARIEGEDGKVLVVYSDIDRLERHMKELAPGDKDVIEELAAAIRRMIDFPMPVEKAPDLFTPIDMLRMMSKFLPFMNFFRKYGKMTIGDFAQRFRDPFLRMAFTRSVNLENGPDFPLMALLISLAWMDQKVAGYPVGGSLEFARAIEGRYLALGGKVAYRSRVDRILVEDGRAVGVRLADGSEHSSDLVISAADGRTTIFDMLDGKYIDKKVRGYYDRLPVADPAVYIGLGVARSFEDAPRSVTGTDVPLDEPIIVGGRERDRMTVQLYNFDPTLAPEGRTVVKVMFTTDYVYWKKLREDRERYRAEKERIADQVVAALDRRYPGFAAQVEMRDVATPMTFERYTGNWQGTFLGWLISTRTLRMRMSKTLPALQNFYMAGQWVEPGGSVPTALMSGRHVTQVICKRDKRKFVTTKP